MDLLTELASRALPYLPSAVTIVVVIVGLVLVSRVLERRVSHQEDARFRQQMIMLALTLLALLVIVVVLPIESSTKGQLLSLLGILLSAAIALSATTFLGNALAGVMLRAVKSFRMGDFIRTGEHFGRVSERGLFHTEIQNEDRELVTLPNLYLVTHPMTTLRTSGTIVSATVSLGYDVPRTTIEELLLAAAKDAGLEEPFVQVLELGDFSVVYRVAGLLTEVKSLISARSRLRGRVMDHLHEGGVEIVSPNFINQRVLAESAVFIPKQARAAASAAPQGAGPEDVVFDKAEQAEALEVLVAKRDELAGLVKAMKTELSAATDEQQKSDLSAEIARLDQRASRLAIAIEARQKRAAGED